MRFSVVTDEMYFDGLLFVFKNVAIKDEELVTFML